MINRTVMAMMTLTCVAALALWMPAAALGAAADAPTGGGPAALPEGHPPMPKGHPPLPQGHPSTMCDMPAMPPDAKGTLVVQAVQGTRKGPAVGADPVVVELVRAGEVVKKIETKLDEKGQVILEDLPVGQIVQPVVQVRHGGADYQAVGQVMHAGPPDQRVTVVVYEPTEEVQAWVIRARHVFVRRVPEGLYVKEMMIVESPTDRAWLGKKVGDERATLTLPLSKNTGRVDFYAGFHQGGTELRNGELINHMALPPGISKFQFGYVVPIGGGKATIEVAVPADTDQLILVLPDDGSKVTATGLTGGEAVEMGPQKMRLFKAEKVKAGTKVGAAVSGLRSGAAATAPPAPKPKDGTSSLPQTIAAVGGGAIVVGGLGLVCFKWLKSALRSA